jgi:hypothetical protein
MSSIARVPQALTVEQQGQASRVKTVSTIALILALGGLFTPFVGLLVEIAAFAVASWAMKINRENGLDLEFEKRAKIARVISGVVFVLWAIGLFLMLMS